MCYIREEKVKASRGKYRCDWCWQFIEISESYLRQSGRADGAWFVAKLHPECAELGMSELEYCETYLPGTGERPDVSEKPSYAN